MRIYLLNNTKPYRDGDEEYAGEWFNCPVDFEEVKEKLGVENEEQIEIADYELDGEDPTGLSLRKRKDAEINNTRIYLVIWRF